MLGKGNYAKVYKISIDKAMPTCLKIFPASVNTSNNPYHGRNVEVQLGLFLNQHSEDFVKMHFGKVCDFKRRDGFLVTQFLGEHIIPIVDENIDDKSYHFEYYDDHKKNYIQGKIIDYGGVGITKSSNLPVSFNLL
ncbi:MAG: hypothetical protein IKL52_07140 [Candidatus Gastranaerophilales bacterium]|nr:hypothetical protein [Candidatus Gastranaerophilales bacterium]